MQQYQLTTRRTQPAKAFVAKTSYNQLLIDTVMQLLTINSPTTTKQTSELLQNLLSLKSCMAMYVRKYVRINILDTELVSSTRTLIV